MPPASQAVPVVVVGAGAAGLMAAVQAARAGARVAALDGARTLGAKILVAGGGRCNVTHHAVDETAFAGSSRKAIRKVLGRFTVADTVAFFADLGVDLKREDTGKLFPVTDSARTVLDALLGAAADAGVVLRHPWRVDTVARGDDGFVVTAEGGDVLRARRVVLATGGRSLPKSGSDGHGLRMARDLGHSLTGRIEPALVPLLLPEGHPLRALAGLSFEARVRAGSGDFTGSVLCTHFGLSGPAVLDASRYWVLEGGPLLLDFLPGADADGLDTALVRLGGRTVRAHLRAELPERLADAALSLAGVSPERTGATLPRTERRRLVETLKGCEVPVTGTRGYRYAEVTAGGVPLPELRLDTLESRICPGLHLCGEMCDVDGRIGGFNFQWAWASGTVAGRAAAAAVGG